MNRSRIIHIVTVAVLIGGVWSWHWLTDTGRTARAEEGRLTAVMQDIAGGSKSLQSWAGQTRLVNFWATWCAPCRAEMPLFQEAHQRLQDRDFVVIGIALDKAAAVKEFKSRLGITYPLLIVDTRSGMRLMSEFGNPAGVVPHSVLLSPEGEILNSHLGAFDEARLNSLLERHLK